MKLADDALVQIIEFLRQGLVEGRDISGLLRGLDLVDNGQGKLGMGPTLPNGWTASETD